MQLSDILASTAEAAYAVDRQGRIAGWNLSCQRLLGLDPEQVLGRRCYEVVAGRDLFGNRWCRSTCPVMRMVRQREPVHPFEIVARTAAQEEERLRVSVLCVQEPASGEQMIVHVLQRVGAAEAQGLAVLRPVADGAPGAPAPLAGRGGAQGPSRRARLTEREVDVLRWIAAGTGTRELAGLLCISPSTVRNHLQSAFSKLGAHNRMQAVAVARQAGLI